MPRDFPLDVVHTSVANLDGVLVAYLVEGMCGWKCLFYIARNCFPMLDLTLLLQGGLNQVTFLFLVRFLGGLFLALGSKVSLCEYSLASRAAW